MNIRLHGIFPISKILTHLTFFVCLWTVSAVAMPRVILETDMTFDVDDVGALAVLHALADRGEAKILGISYNEVHEHGVPTIAAINAWYGRSMLPITKTNELLKNPDKSRYLTEVANLSRLDSPPNEYELLPFYDQLLESSPNKSVVIISVGFLNNLAVLLENRQELIEQKVEKLVVMGGLVNDDFNLVRHGLINQSEFVLAEWPTPIIITDYGGRLYTGESLRESPVANPVREAYFRWFKGRWEGRSSWDQIAVLVGVRGSEWHFNLVGDRHGRLRNGYEWHLDGSHRSYAEPSQPDSEVYRKEIEALMTAKPLLR